MNDVLDGFDAVTPALIQATARDYLRTTNRSVIELVPGAGPRADAEADIDAEVSDASDGASDDTDADTIIDETEE